MTYCIAQGNIYTQYSVTTYMGEEFEKESELNHFVNESLCSTAETNTVL